MASQEIDLYIVAAGHGSRLGGKVPKALVPIVREPCLTSTLRLVKSAFRNIFIVTNNLSRDVWSSYFAALPELWPDLYKKIVHVSIRSGLGDGHATLEGLRCAERIPRIELAEQIVVMWGDVFLPNGNLIQELLSLSCKGAGLIPAISETDPYVCLRVNAEMQCIAADFSKYGEYHSTGFHDQSIFRFHRVRLRAALEDLNRCLWKHDHYISAGGELSLLYAFHQMYNAGEAACVYETKFSTRSFNTWEDVSKIRNEMTDRFGEVRSSPSSIKIE